MLRPTEMSTIEASLLKTIQVVNVLFTSFNLILRINNCVKMFFNILARKCPLFNNLLHINVTTLYLLYNVSKILRRQTLYRMIFYDHAQHRNLILISM